MKRKKNEEPDLVYVMEKDLPFLILPFELPAIPLFKEEQGGNVTKIVKNGVKSDKFIRHSR